MLHKRRTIRRGIAAITLQAIKAYADKQQADRDLQRAIDDGVCAAAISAQLQFFGGKVVL